METTKIGKPLTTPMSGDGGEAVSKVTKTELSAPLKTLEKPADAGWFVAVVRVNCERRIAESIQYDLNVKDVWFESWVPMQKVPYIDRRSKKRKMKEKVFLSTFIFCHVSRQYLDEIRFRSDVYKMLTMPGQREIYRIPDRVLDNYRQLVENPDLPVHAYSGPLRKGQRVRITEGNMAGVEAYVQRISGKKAVIGNEIKYICGATIEINRAFLEVIADE